SAALSLHDALPIDPRSASESESHRHSGRLPCSGRKDPPPAEECRGLPDPGKTGPAAGEGRSCPPRTTRCSWCDAPHPSDPSLCSARVPMFQKFVLPRDFNSGLVCGIKLIIPNKFPQPYGIRLFLRIYTYYKSASHIMGIAKPPLSR